MKLSEKLGIALTSLNAIDNMVGVKNSSTTNPALIKLIEDYNDAISTKSLIELVEALKRNVDEHGSDDPYYLMNVIGGLIDIVQFTGLRHVLINAVGSELVKELLERDINENL